MQFIILATRHTGNACQSFSLADSCGLPPEYVPKGIPCLIITAGLYPPSGSLIISYNRKPHIYIVVKLCRKGSGQVHAAV